MTIVGGMLTTGGQFFATQEVQRVPYDSLGPETLVVVAMSQRPEGQDASADWFSTVSLMLFAYRGPVGQRDIFDRIGPVYPDPNPEGFEASAVIVDRELFYLAPRANSTLHKLAQGIVTGEAATKKARVEGESGRGVLGDGGTIGGNSGKQSDGRHQASDSDGRPRYVMTKDGLKHLPSYFPVWRLSDPGRSDVYGGSNVGQFDARLILSDVLAKAESLALLDPSDPWWSAGLLVHIRATVVLTDVDKTARFLQFDFKRWDLGGICLLDFLSSSERGRYYPPSSKDLVTSDFLSVLVKALENLTYAMCAFFSARFEGAFARVIAQLRDPRVIQKLRAFTVRFVVYRVGAPLNTISSEVRGKYESSGALQGPEVWTKRLDDLLGGEGLLPSGEMGLQDQRCFYDDVDPLLKFGADDLKTDGRGAIHHGSRDKGKSKGGKSSTQPAGGTPPAHAPRVAVVTPATGGGSRRTDQSFCLQHLRLLLNPSMGGCAHKGKCKFDHLPLGQTSYASAKSLIGMYFKTPQERDPILASLEARTADMLP